MKFVDVLSIILITAGLPGALCGQTASFTFAPRLDVLCTETEVRNTTTTLSTGTNRTTISTDHSTSTDEIRYEKRADEYFMSDQTLKMSGEINGKTFENPMAAILISVIPTNVISKEGRLLRVLGTEQIAIQAEKVFPPKAFSQIEAQLNTNVLERVAKTRWNDSVGVVVGRTVKQGDIWKNMTSYGDANLHFEYVFPSIVQTESNTVVTILTFGSTNPELFDLYKLENAKNLESREVKEFLNFSSGSSLKICVKSVIDANTMEIQGEDEIQQTTSLAADGLNTEEEHDIRDYQYQRVSH